MNQTNAISGIVQKNDLYYSKLSRSSKPGKSEKLSKPRRAQGDMTTECNVLSWKESWNRKRTLRKN